MDPSLAKPYGNNLPKELFSPEMCIHCKKKHSFQGPANQCSRYRIEFRILINMWLESASNPKLPDPKIVNFNVALVSVFCQSARTGPERKSKRRPPDQKRIYSLLSVETHPQKWPY
ncbi:hypothetical protein PoB_005788300 [Plakobranchus ocellatus]|uniref:Uncharacterized protein n=1 Tax=Plakobranchus ocellatus TaxID=259542 RepID=A0AAV4CK17_9GAST|nr:hypothetical protein PoB_005788300 [Plakobranchus ocellatus]